MAQTFERIAAITVIGGICASAAFVAIVDKDGRIVSNADREITFSISGAGTLAGVSNGDPATHQQPLANQCQTFRGRCMVLVKVADRTGAISVRATTSGLSSAATQIETSSQK